MNHFPVGMEMFSAADEEQWQIISETIDVSDYYVLIVGNRYGSIIQDGEDAGISYTEKEFRYALKQGIPVQQGLKVILVLVVMRKQDGNCQSMK